MAELFFLCQPPNTKWEGLDQRFLHQLVIASQIGKKEEGKEGKTEKKEKKGGEGRREGKRKERSIVRKPLLISCLSLPCTESSASHTAFHSILTTDL